MINTPWNGDTAQEEAFFESKPGTFENELTRSPELRNVLGAAVASFIAALHASQAFAKDTYRRGVTQGMGSGNSILGAPVDGTVAGPGWSHFLAYNEQLAIGIVAKILVDSFIPDKWKKFEKAIVTTVLVIGYLLTLGVDVVADGKADFNRFMLAISVATQIVTHWTGPDTGNIEDKHFSLKGHILPQALVANICAALQCFIPKL